MQRIRKQEDCKKARFEEALGPMLLQQRQNWSGPKKTIVLPWYE